MIEWLKTLFSDSDQVSSKRLVVIMSLLVLIEITQVWLFTNKVYDTTQFIFITGFWIFAGGYSGYLTIKKKIFSGKKEPEIKIEKDEETY